MQLSNLSSNFYTAKDTLVSGLNKAWNYTKENPKKTALAVGAFSVAALVSNYAFQHCSIYFFKIPARLQEIQDPGSNILSPGEYLTNNPAYTFTVTQKHRNMNAGVSKVIPDNILSSRVVLRVQTCTSSSLSEPTCSWKKIAAYDFYPIPFISSWLSNWLLQ